MMLWGEAVRHMVWLKNCTLTQALEGITPLQAMTSKQPDLSKIQEWGCAVWVHTNGALKLELGTLSLRRLMGGH